MAEFLTQKRLESKITDIIFQAQEQLLILSPYIKLDEYFRQLFSNHLKNPKVSIILVFGKNEDNKGKSLGKDDFEFFKKFPNISILYLPNLHAKYYANENEGVVTSINLYDYSFQNNIEFGISSKNPDHNILGLASIKNPFVDGIDSTAWEYAWKFMETAEAVYIKRPVIEKKLLGFSTNYHPSEELYDNTQLFTNRYAKTKKERKCFNDFPDFLEFGKAAFQQKPTREEFENRTEVGAPQAANIPPINYRNQQSSKFQQPRKLSHQSGFCIRHGSQIHFNPDQPYSTQAFQSWNQWKNPDYQEKYCHSCGKPHPTSMRMPLCDSCYYN